MDAPKYRRRLNGNRPQKLRFSPQSHIPFMAFSQLQNGIWFNRAQSLENQQFSYLVLTWKTPKS